MRPVRRRALDPAPPRADAVRVSARVRQVLLLSVLVVLVATRAQQTGAFFALPGAPHTFPRDVVVATSPTPNIYGDRAELRVLQLVDSMNAMWTRAFAAAGDEYARPRVVTTTVPPKTGCASKITGWAGVYCFPEGRIVIDIGSQQVRAAVLGEDGADAMLGYVLAHEIGHHVQALRGNRHLGAADDVLRAELHAECLAGLWGRAAGHAPPPHWSYSADAAHGTVAQQRSWLERGHAAGRPSDCDDVWSATL
jgi:predicted metalloprotease